MLSSFFTCIRYIRVLADCWCAGSCGDAGSR